MSKQSSVNRPLIGLTSGTHPRNGIHCLAAYVNAVRHAGAMPVLLPPGDDLGEIELLRERLDGVLLIGGPDIDPLAYGAEPHPETKPMEPLRQAWDLALTRAVLGWPDMPLFAICLGIQELCVASGGSLIQHLPDNGLKVEHRSPSTGERLHSVQVAPDSLLASIVGAAGTLQVNTRHHQGLDALGDGLRVTARAEDGVIEAVELPDRRFALGVQWHPERITDQAPHAALFRAFVNACRRN